MEQHPRHDCSQKTEPCEIACEAFHDRPLQFECSLLCTITRSQLALHPQEIGRFRPPDEMGGNVEPVLGVVGGRGKARRNRRLDERQDHPLPPAGPGNRNGPGVENFLHHGGFPAKNGWESLIIPGFSSGAE